MSHQGFVKRFATKEQGLNAFQASLLAIPVLGPSFEKLLFGAVAEARLYRIEFTLKEVIDKLNERSETPPIEENEDFARLVEDVIPPLGKATNETKRKMFRDLLYNSSKIPMGDYRWEETSLVAKTMDEISYFGLEIIAAIHHCATANDNTLVVRLNTQLRKIEVGLINSTDEFSIAKPFDNNTRTVAITAQSAFILDKTMRDLEKLDILSFDRESTMFTHVFLQEFGELIVSWTIDDQEDSIGRDN